MDITEILPFFHEQRFIPELQATTKQAAIEELADKFVETRVIRNKELLLEMLNRRESVGSTGIGHGIAMPHGRTTATTEIIVAFGRSKKGIAWEAMDNKPVHLIFLIVAPPNEDKNLYLPMLGTLVEFLSKEENRKKLMNISTFEAFCKALTE